MPVLTRYGLVQSRTVTSPAANFSDVAYSPVTDTVYGVCNNPLTVTEFTRSGDVLRSWTLGVGYGDTEGICWAYDDVFIIADEDTSIFGFPRLNAGNAGTTIALAANRSVNTGLGNLDGTTGGGFEGVGYDAERNIIYAVKERRTTAPTYLGMGVYEIVGSTGLARELFNAGTVLGATGVCTDLAAMHFDPISKHLFLLSEESDKVIECDVSGTVFGTRQLSVEATMTQPEGITFSRDGRTVWLCGEPNEWRRFEMF